MTAASGLVACACVDAAIWDAVGKALGQPLWRLWGGYRRRLPMIAIGGYYGEGADIAPRSTALLELGLARHEAQGRRPRRRRRTPSGCALPARAGGDDFVLAVDANQAWTPREAIRFARLVEDLGLRWFEEPCRWHNDRARDARRPLRRRRARLRRPERVLGRAAAAI